MLQQGIAGQVVVVFNADGIAPTGYQVVKSDGTLIAAPTGTLTTPINNTTAQVALSAADVATLGPVSIIIIVIGGGVGGLLNESVEAISDPWATALPGAYAAGQAGQIVGANLDAAVSSRAAPGAQMDLVNAPNATALAAIALEIMTLANGVEPGWTLQQVMRLVSAVLAGKVSIAGAIVTLRNPPDTKNRVVATTDATGQRTAVTYDVS
jgi:hypothetical protein